MRLAGPPPSNAKLEPPQGELQDAIRERLAPAPASGSTSSPSSRATPEELHEALWDLAWAGEATNDAFAPLRAPRLRAVQRRERAGRRFSSRRVAANSAVQGRWSLVADLLREAPAAGPADCARRPS